MRRRGFTLVEIMLVLAITGVLASMFLPRISFHFEPTSALLQRSIEEAGDKALSGISVRFVLNPAENSRRGEIITEALLKREVPANSLSAFLGTAQNTEILEWQPFNLANSPAGNGWYMEPDVIYFYTDGSCTPANISWAGPGVPEKDAENYILTVTGYCTQIH